MKYLDQRKNKTVAKPDLNDDETLWLVIRKQDFSYWYRLITEKWGYHCNLENWVRFAVLPNFDRIDVLHVTKTANYFFETITYTRPVTTPYVDSDGKPRGWHYDENGNKVRETGLGNVFFVSDIDTAKSLLSKMVH